MGDDDQSIYRFRGATIDNILNFEHQFKGARLIRLEQNYRSTGKILEAANAVIRNNRARKGKKLWTENPEGEELTLYEAMNEADEANFLTSSIFRRKEKSGASFHDFAVLYRTNAQSNAVEHAFKANAVPYRIIGGTRFYDRAEVKDMIAYLCLIQNHADDLRLMRILNNPPRGIGGKTVEVVSRLATAAELPLFSVIERAADYPALEKSAKKLREFAALITECGDALKQMTLPEFYDLLLERTGYSAMLRQKDDVENRSRLENVLELRSSLVGYEENHPEDASLAGFLEEVALYTDIDRYDKDADAVVMMTMHAAKGLEFPHVYLIGMEEGLFPGTRSLGEPEELEEERRLCYVAITRAKLSLTLTCAEQRMLYGRTSINEISRFVREIPAELLHGADRAIPPRAAAFGFRSDRAKHAGYDTVSSRSRPPYEPGRTVYGGAFNSAGKKETEPLPELKPGMMVRHNSFGRGMITSVVRMGNDAMLEVAFDAKGTKRLLARAALINMKIE